MLNQHENYLLSQFRLIKPSMAIHNDLNKLLESSFGSSIRRNGSGTPKDPYFLDMFAEFKRSDLKEFMTLEQASFVCLAFARVQAKSEQSLRVRWRASSVYSQSWQ